MIDIQDTGFEGLKVIRPIVRPDVRGRFVKLIHTPTFAAAGLAYDFPEQYVTTSVRGVLRGMHYQRRPHDHAKLVYCLSGRVLDVVLDLRQSSVSYGRAFGLELDGGETTGIFVPRGFAHGFLTLSDNAVLHYFVQTVHAPDYDTGLRWNSFGFNWPVSSPLLSPRDENLPHFDRFFNYF